MAPVQPAYRAREVENTALYQIVRDNLSSFLQDTRDEGGSLPTFVARTFERFLDCGIPARGFVRAECKACRHNLIIPLSCKMRGVCSSCGGRRMSQTAAHLVERVLPEVPVRQWVVTFPIAWRLRLGYDPDFCSSALRIVIRAISGWMRRRGRDYLGLDSVRNLQTGCVAFIQRWRSDLALNPHLHILFLDGVYIENEGEEPEFRAIPGPLKRELVDVALRIGGRLRRLIGEDEDASGSCAVDELAEAEPLLAACGAASVQRRIATGPRAGQRVPTLHVAPRFDADAQRGLCAQVDGINIHAGVRIPASDRNRLERLCRYVARSPIAGNRLRLDDEGQVIYELRRPWSDGTAAIRLSPNEFLEKLAALVPRPWRNQTRYFGALAPYSRLRPFVVPRPPPAETGPGATVSSCHWIPWAELLKRVFKVDMEVCARCGGGPVRIVALIMKRDAIRSILESCGLSTAPPERKPARQRPLFDEFAA